MGTWTLDEMKTEIRDAFGGTTEWDDKLTLLLNQAQTRLVRLHDFEELKVRDTFGNTVNGGAGQESADMVIALPSLTREIYSLALIDDAESRKLTQVPSRQWDARIPFAEYYARGKVTLYRRWGNGIEVWRVPDEVKEIRGHRSKWPTPFSAGGDFSDLEFKDDLITTLAIIWLAIQVDRKDRANYYWSYFKTIYDEALTEADYHPDLVATRRFMQSPTVPLESHLNPFVGQRGEQVE